MQMLRTSGQPLTQQTGVRTLAARTAVGPIVGTYALP